MYKLPRTVGDIYEKRIDANVYLWYVMLECGHEHLIGTRKDLTRPTELTRARCYECKAKEN